MNHPKLCYYNGELIPFGEIRIPVSDLQFQRGYGVFDFFRCREGRIPWLNDYLDRLYNSLMLSGLEIALDREQIKSVLQELQQSNGMDNGAFKIIVTGGLSNNLESADGPASILILNVPWNGPATESFEQGVKLISDHYIRPNPEVKTLYYFNSLRLQKKFREYKAAEVLYHTDRITEASRASVFFVKGTQLSTPAINILKGITRKRVLSQFSEIREEEIEARNLYEFDEIFICSTSRDVTPVISIDGKMIGLGKPGPITREIQAKFHTAPDQIEA